jgi:Mor family transcriptional regulator
MVVVKALEDLVLNAMRVYDARLALALETQQRDELIRAAHSEGHSLRDIAAIARVSHQTVANVVAAGAATTTSQHQPPS